MAKNKHELLAAQLKKILKDHSDFSKKVLNTLNLIQMHFYEPILLIGQPIPTDNFLSKMTKAHLIGLQFFSPSSKIKKASQELPCFGAIIPKKYYLKSETFESSEGTWIIPWNVKVVLPMTQLEKTNEQLINILLYCPDKSEFCNEIDWFESEDSSNLLTSQLDELFNHNACLAIIRKNLIQLAKPLYDKILKKWRYDPNEETGADLISNNDETMNKTSFAPNDKDNIAYAYEKVLKVLKEGKYKRYFNLMRKWKKCLEDTMFINVIYTTNQKNIFINQWHHNLFGHNLCNFANEGRWEQGKSIDRTSAIKIILYFINKFLKDPNNKKTEGELACFLWTLVWLSYELHSTNISLSEVRKLKTSHLKDYLELSYKTDTVEISYGLHQLLSILKGKGKEKRLHYLFPNLESKSQKWLETIFKKASIDIFGKDADIVSLGAFCSFPHNLKGIRKSNTRRSFEQKNAKQNNFLEYNRKEILKTFTTKK